MERVITRSGNQHNSMGKIIQSGFQPAGWLRSRHLQTIWPSFFRKSYDFTPQWERVELNDGDFIDLAWHPRPDSPLILMIHGLEGSIDSHYAGNMLAALHKVGFSSVLLHLRGRGREPNRLPESYHSGKTADLRLILDHLQQKGQMPVGAIGVSLGANLLLKYLGEAGSTCPFKQAVAISVPFQLGDCARQLEHGFAKVYGRYLLNRLKSSYQNKFSRMESPLQVDLQAIRTLWQFDDAVTAPLHDFAGADDYYQQSSCSQFLNSITTPTLILHAKDDPFMTTGMIPQASDMSDSVTLELSEHGGHVGFICGKPGRPEFWLERRVTEYFHNEKLSQQN